MKSGDKAGIVAGLKNQFKKKEVKHTEKKMNLTSLIDMLNEKTEKVNKIISIRQILKINQIDFN